MPKTGHRTQRRVQEIEFELIAIGVDSIRSRMDVIVSVPNRIDVWPSAQQEAVNDRHEFVDGIPLWRQDYWNATCCFNSAHIWRGRAIAQERPVGERVLLCGWGYADDRLHVAAVPFLRCGGPCCYEYREKI